MRKNKIIQDPIFGRVVLHEYDSEIRRKEIPFDTNLKMCSNPFFNLSININGEVWVCCRDWSQYSVGNIKEKDDLINIWNGKPLKEFRNSITDGSYVYCGERCPYLLSEMENSAIHSKTSILKHVRENPIPNIALSVDKSCNLQCPSCRNEKILSLSEQEEKQARIIINEVLDTFYFEPHKLFLRLKVIALSDESLLTLLRFLLLLRIPLFLLLLLLLLLLLVLFLLLLLLCPLTSISKLHNDMSFNNCCRKDIF